MMMACLLILIACMAQHCNNWCKKKLPIDVNIIVDVSQLVGGREEEWKTSWMDDQLFVGMEYRTWTMKKCKNLGCN